MINVCIVDDELLPLQLLENYVTKTAGISLWGKYRNPGKALQEIQTNPIDILFIDIEMPQLTGIELVKQLNLNNTAVIFCTAFSEYAIDAFDIDAVDYLIKPISYTRFLRSVEKAKEYLFIKKNKERYDKVPVIKEDQSIIIKTNYKLSKIDIKDILYIEGLGEYIKIHCVNTRYVTFERMKTMEDLLPSADFKRIHKSYIASLAHIKGIGGYSVEMINGDKMPLSRDKKKELMENLLNR